ncbi:MAG: hypothetical protein OXE86_04475 [Alphaproteobacteria bacterium]|nr:hypothetical protein [Alphaproteobacteria bacterium]
MLTPPAPSMSPERLRIVIEDLWQLSMRSEEGVHRSRAFCSLEDACRSIYLGLEESRLHRAPSAKVTPSVLSRALHNFFRWNGAPWFGDRTPDAAETAESLHRAFLRKSVRRTYLVPLDRLSLEDRSGDRTQEVTSVRFGSNEIVRLDGDDLARRVPVDALARFGVRYRFPTAELDGFYWLATRPTEPAGPLERRTWLDRLNTVWGKLDTVELFRSTYPMPVEDALFVLLLIFLKDPGDALWRPFRIPWMFSFTDDPFSDPVAPPDPSSLSRQVVGDEYDYIEVPDRSEIFEFGAREHDVLQQRWNDFETVLGRRGPASASFHPLTRHFFIKPLSEYGVDEIISNLSCLEATLRLKEERRREKLTRRFAHLVADEQAAQWLESTYRLRNEYLHSLADPHQKLTWTDLARARWIVATAVKNYLDFAVKHPEFNRSRLLKLLERQPQVL